MAKIGESMGLTEPGTAEQLSYRFTREDGCFRLETRAECEEMIARQTGAAFIKDGDQ